MHGGRRGQVPLPMWKTAIIVVGTALGVIVVGTVTSELNHGLTESDLGAAAENTTTLCNGILGCGQVGPMQILTPLLLIVLAIFIMSIVAPMVDSPPTDGNATDDVVAAYVDPDGDIDTELELEARLEDTIDEDDVWEDL